MLRNYSLWYLLLVLEVGPEERKEAVIRPMDLCAVKKCIVDLPEF
jgi:hypothetical protein